MSTTFEKISSNKVKIGFVVPAEKFDDALKSAYHKQVKRFSIPGFRKGKAPMKVIENYYGAGVFYEEALQILFPEVYQEALKEHDVHAVDQPEIDVTQIGHGQDLEFSIEVFVRPDVTLGQYTNLGLVKEVEEVTDEDVGAEIERARERASRYIEVTDRPAKLDDQVNIDYAGFLGDEQFDGGTATNQDLVLGSGHFIPGFEDQLVGLEVGAEAEVHVTFPENYDAKNLAGKPVVFKVKVNAIQEKETPALDDDFVAEASETANTVDEYKSEIRARLEKEKEERADSAYESTVIDAVCENAQVDIPAAMIEEQMDSLLEDFQMRLAYQGLKLDDYTKYTGQSRDQIRESYREHAEERVRMQLVVEAIMKAENIAATDEEVDAEIGRYAEQNQKSLEEFKSMLSEDDKAYFAEIASMQKTVAFLKANAAGTAEASESEAEAEAETETAEPAPDAE